MLTCRLVAATRSHLLRPPLLDADPTPSSHPPSQAQLLLKSTPGVLPRIAPKARVFLWCSFGAARFLIPPLVSVHLWSSFSRDWWTKAAAFLAFCAVLGAIPACPARAQLGLLQRVVLGHYRLSFLVFANFSSRPPQFQRSLHDCIELVHVSRVG